MKKIFFLLMIAGISAVPLMAQPPVLQKVKIEFERKVNTWASLQGSFAEEMKSRIPQYSSSFYSYETDGTKSLYKAIPSTDNSNNRSFFRQQDDENATFTDFSKDEQVSLKSVFEKTYLLTDSLRYFDWKITNDFREIAGFNCRRATTIIMDSVFVVAFYTNEILAPGGPEGFTGLPGTILGLVINRLHTTWYATKVSVTNVDPAKILPPVAPRAEKTTRKKLIESLTDRFKQGDRFGSGDRLIWGLMI